MDADRLGAGGPLAQAAGHDITYNALTGALWSMGGRGSGRCRRSTSWAISAAAACCWPSAGRGVLEASAAAARQVVDAAMKDGSATLMGAFFGRLGQGRWRNAREANLLDGACPYYDTYECADRKYVAVGALEPQFFAALIGRLGLEAARFADRTEPARWPAIRSEFAAIFRSRPRDHWATLFEGSDACVAPVLDLEEAPRHPHNAARGTFFARGGAMQPAPSPRFSRTQPGLPSPAPKRGEGGVEALAGWGLSPEEIAALRG